MSLIRPEIDAMRGYTPGEQPRATDVIKLNTNENPYPPSPKVIEAIHRAAGANLRRYPDPVSTAFRQAAAGVLDVPADWIVACNGSDDALTILTRAVVGPNDLMVAPTPSYPLYQVLAQLQSCRYELRPFDSEWRLPKGFCDGARLAFVPNPNSPTGTMIPPRELLDVAKGSPGIVVADEAYADFADENCAKLVKESERLVVTRSFSKSYSLAGVRFGFLIAQPAIVEAALKVKDSYNCDALSQAAATAAILDRDFFDETRSKILSTRARLDQGLKNLGFTTIPSQANFVWARRAEPVEPVYQALKERRILIRLLRYPSYGEGLRVSVGTDAEIDALLAEMAKIV